MLNSVHTAVSNLYGFIQSNKRCLQTESGQHRSEFLNHTIFLILKLAATVTSISLKNIGLNNEKNYLKKKKSTLYYFKR